MTALDRNDRIPDDAPQNKVKLEWITPKISLMEGGDTDGTKVRTTSETHDRHNHRSVLAILPQPCPLQQIPIAPTGLQRPFFML